MLTTQNSQKYAGLIEVFCSYLLNDKLYKVLTIVTFDHNKICDLLAKFHSSTLRINILWKRFGKK